MILSKRERTLAVASVAVLGVFALNQYVLSPLLDRRERVGQELRQTQETLQQHKALVAARPGIEVRWRDMQSAGLMADVSTSESQLLNAIREWASESGLALSALKPDRVAPGKVFQKLKVSVAATGNMRQVRQFLLKIHRASIPVQIADMQLSARKDGMDDLSLEIRLTTLCAAPGSSGKGTAVAAREVTP